MPSEPDYAALLAEMEKEKENLEAAMAFVRKKMGLNSSTPDVPATGSDRIKSDSFYRLGIGEAAVAYLRMTNRTPKTSNEIADVLDRGGLVHQSKDLKATVNALLIRDGGKWGITRLPSGAWGLDEWYPGSARGKKTKGTKTRAEAEELGEDAAGENDQASGEDHTR